MNWPAHIADATLPLVSDVIDAVHAAADENPQAVVLLTEQLTPEQTALALSTAVGMAAGCVNQLAALTGTDRQVWIRHMRRQAAA